MKMTESREKTFRRIWGILPALVLGLMIVLLIMLGIRVRTEGERIKAEKLAALHKDQPPVNVVVLQVIPNLIRDRLDLPAQVEPWIELKLLAEVAGKVTNIAVAEGDFVKQGDLIAQLDVRDYENELASARSEYELAKKDLERSKSLFDSGLIARASFDQNVSRVEKLLAAVRNAELRLERCSIRAPLSGVINRLDVEVGLLLSVQDPVAVILDISRVKVAVGIPESDVNEVRRLDEFEVTIDALGGKKVRGAKAFLSRSPESLAHLYRLEIEVQNPAAEILPGMFARAEIVKKEVRNSISVPLYSVITRKEGNFVFVEDGGKARMKNVETGILEGWMMQVTRGLSEGDRVIVVGHRSVNDGQDVNVVRSVSGTEELL